MMKAISYERYGPPEVLNLKDLEKPQPKANELLIKVQAAEVTKADCELRSFKLPVNWTWLPMRIAIGFRKPRKQVLGMYFAGEVEAMGQNVSQFKKGDQIFGSSAFRLGAYGEYVCLPETYTVVPMPDNVSFEEAASIPLGGLNALHFLRLAKLQWGEKVLINGAGGSIGIVAIQLAKTMGAEVTAVDSDVKEEMLQNIGADHFIDYRKEDFSNGGQTYDVILSMVASTPYSRVIRVLNPGGRYLLANPRLVDMMRAGFSSSFTDKKVIFAFAKETKEELLTLKTMIEQGKLKPVIDGVFPMSKAAEAHGRVETEQRLGSVIISMQA
ncbi:MAG: NAD(P)-dependent alcohol dehydrogenase [Trueperaceae bacterium]|nr:NAD(P)-dependent alcohol dehydrogenase [Trueperaceae bacterium]